MIENLDSGASPLALYLHVPFCFHKCHYCDFYSIVNTPHQDADQQARFTDRLVQELRFWAQRLTLQPRTIFVGGGTPTLLRLEHWRTLLDVLKSLGILSRTIEFTVEANPETVSPQLMTLLVRGGVNRVSLGAQTFDPALLKTLERWHEPSSVGRAVRLCREVGLTNLNLDLIFAIPGQTLPLLDADLDQALSLGPSHLSCYSLIFEPHTPLEQKRQSGRIAPVDEDLEAAMYARVIERLGREGFVHYEVSNWARSCSLEAAASTRQTAFCQHNLAYWTNAHWLGLGPSAASHIAGVRWKNQPHPGRYLDSTGQPPVTDVERLAHDRSVGERLMLRLRLIEGAPRPWVDELLRDDAARRQTVRELVAIGMLECTATHLKLTRGGLFVADAVIARLL